MHVSPAMATEQLSVMATIGCTVLLHRTKTVHGAPHNGHKRTPSVFIRPN
jgi:hypothetical protein